jgi:hypothetical protein
MEIFFGGAKKFLDIPRATEYKAGSSGKRLLVTAAE